VAGAAAFASGPASGVSGPFPFEPFFTFDVAGMSFRVTFVTFVMFGLTVLLSALFITAFARPAIVPGKLQNVMEAAIDGIRQNVVHQTIGPEGERFLPYLTALFFFVFGLGIDLTELGRLAWLLALAVPLTILGKAAGALHLAVDGLLTHLACADEPDRGVTEDQLVAFDQFLALAHSLGLRPRWVHAANTAGTLLFPASRHTLVRPGIGIYGLSPDLAVDAAHHGLQPALSLVSEVGYVDMHDEDITANQQVCIGWFGTSGP
jgi:hypothetical protein